MQLPELLRKKFQQKLPGPEAQKRMSPEQRDITNPGYNGEYKPSAVLLLLYPKNDFWSIVFIRRNIYKGPHSGQISFPGGKFEKTDKDYTETALRETYEETGVEHKKITILGKLSTLNVPVSGFIIHPYVGIMNTKPEFNPDPAEVQEIITIPLHELFSDRNKRIEIWNFKGKEVKVPVYNYNGVIIWGATAMILSEFESLISPL